MRRRRFTLNLENLELDPIRAELREEIRRRGISMMDVDRALGWPLRTCARLMKPEVYVQVPKVAALAEFLGMALVRTTHTDSTQNGKSLNRANTIWG